MDPGQETLHENRPEIGDKFLLILAGKCYYTNYLDLFERFIHTDRLRLQIAMGFVDIFYTKRQSHTQTLSVNRAQMRSVWALIEWLSILTNWHYINKP